MKRIYFFVTVSLLTVYCTNLFAQHFSHQQGMSGRPLMEVGTAVQQSVHEYNQVVYLASGESVTLDRMTSASENFFRYNRWFDYQTDMAASSNLKINGTPNTTNAYGAFFFENQSLNDLNARYTMPNPAVYEKVAVDQSAYNDYSNAVVSSHTTYQIKRIKASDITSMNYSSKMTVFVVCPRKKGGYVLGYNGGTASYSQNFSSEADIIALLETLAASANASNYQFVIEPYGEKRYMLYSKNGKQTPVMTSGSNYTSYSWGTADWNNRFAFAAANPSSYANLCVTSNLVRLQQDLIEYYPSTRTVTRTLCTGTNAAGLNYSTSTNSDETGWCFYALVENVVNESDITEPTLSQRRIFDIRPASEIASKVDAAIGSQWLEVHNMTAPTSNQLYIGPDHGYLAAAPYPGYYYNAARPASLKSATWIWKANGTQFTPASVSAGQFAQIPRVYSAGMVEYTLQCRVGSVTYNIAKFNVNYQRKDVVGPYPTLVDVDARLNGTSLLAEQDFNFSGSASQIVASHGNNFYTVPLQQDESSCGFYYVQGKNYRSENINSWDGDKYKKNYYSEYSLSSGTNDFYGGCRTFTNHGGGEGFLLYADGSSRPSQVFSLNIDAELCAGSSMYMSAYVGNVASADATAPNLDFVLVGLDDDGNETVLNCYTTGEFANNSDEAVCQGKWLHILYPVEFTSSVKFAHYKLRISNKGANDAGNDFVIDDIKIYLSLPPVIPIQASTYDCIVDSALVTTYLRVNYQAVSKTADTYYYQWRDEASNVINASYLNGTSTAGVVHIPATIPASMVYADLLDFDTHFKNTPTAGYGFVKERVDMDSIYILYIAQPIMMYANRTYTGYVAQSLDQLGPGQQCGMFADLMIAGATRISVDGVGGADRLSNKCGNRQYQLDIDMVVVAQNDVTGTLEQRSFACRADWMYGDSTYVNEHLDEYAGADFATIYAALMAYQSNILTQEQDELLQMLISYGLLNLNVSGIEIQPVTKGGGVISYTAFPHPAEEGEELVCTTPRTITLLLPEDQVNAVVIGNKGEVLPQHVASVPRKVRVGNRTKNSGSMTANMYLTGSQEAVYSVTQAVLTDATYPEWSTLPNRYLSVSPTTLTKDVSNITFGGNALKGLVPGYDYTFRLDMTVNDTICSEGYTYFTIRVVPDSVTWSPVSTNNAWNNDANWNPFAPLAETNVILLSGDYTVPAPVMHDTMQLLDLEASAQQYISYDLGYDAYSCNNIRIPAGTSLLGQHLLSIGGQAFVDMAFVPGKWTMSSFPIKGVVSGDLYIPVSETTEPFIVTGLNQYEGAAATDRTAYPVYASLYNKVARSYDRGGAEFTSTGWVTATNDVANSFSVSQGVMVGIDADGEEDLIIRFPKPNTEYCYYKDGVYVSEDRTAISRNGEYGKPAYNATTLSNGETGMAIKLTNNVASRTFLLGNPTFASIDIERLIAGNASVLVDEYTASGVSDSRNYDHAVVAGGVSSDGADHHVLPPHRSVILTAPAEQTSLTLNLTVDMLCDPAGRTFAAPAPAPRKKALAQNGVDVIYINATAGSYTASTAIAQSAAASDSIEPGEDAAVVLLKKTYTPFALYTVADGEALAVNHFSNLSTIPLAMYAQKSVANPQVTFSGDDAYLWEWDLVTLSGEHTQLSDGLTITLAMPQDGTVGYYLEHVRSNTQTGGATSLNDNSDSDFSLCSQNGQLLITSGEDMTDFLLTDAVGHVLSAQANAGKCQSFFLPKGVYIVRANGHTEKALVK